MAWRKRADELMLMRAHSLSRRQLLAGTAAAGLQARPPLPSAYCRYAKSLGAEALKPGDRAWTSGRAIHYDRAWNDAASHAPQATTAVTLWNERYFHIKFDCRYGSLNVVPHPDLSTDQPIYERDCAEFFAATDPGDLQNYKEFEWSPAGEWFDARIHNPNGRISVAVTWNTGMQVLAGIEEEKKRWWVTAAIPIHWLAVPKPGDRWRANFYRIEGPPKQGPNRIHLAWSPTLTPQPNFHVPQRFGWLEFI
jgi:hypothetical protein